MAKENLSISFSDVSELLASNSIAITSTELVNALVQDAATAVNLLTTQVASVSLNDISIDPLGRVIVQNAEFVNKLKDSATHEAASNNGVCGEANAYKCGG